jgi:ssDNA-binding Zn-finger/Zn-ribbon topoisomerase 1
MDVPITELKKLDVTRIDAVDNPANGFPVLIMKAAAEPVAKGARDCPKCDKTYDADHQGDECEGCGAKLPDAPAAKAADAVDCPTCKGDGKMRGNSTDCPDCGATGKVTPAKAKTLAAKSVVKAIVGRKVDESPDIAGGTAVIEQIADLIIGEAQELKAGNTGEISDIMQLACAAEMMWTWRTGEESVAAGSVMPATALMQSAAPLQPVPPQPVGQSVIDAAEPRIWSYQFGGFAKEKHNAADRKKLADQGNALSDGSYPIADEEDLKSAAILAQSGHGDVEGAKRLITRRAKELGVKNPLDGDTADAAKSQIAKEGAEGY